MGIPATMLMATAACALLVGSSFAGTLVGGKIPGDDTSSDQGAPGTFLCSDTAGVEAYCADQGVTPANGGKFHTVCINDFTYYPPISTPRECDVVAWINVEK